MNQVLYESIWINEFNFHTNRVQVSVNMRLMFELWQRPVTEHEVHLMS